MNTKADVNRRVLAIQAKKKRHKPNKKRVKQNGLSNNRTQSNKSHADEEINEATASAVASAVSETAREAENTHNHISYYSDNFSTSSVDDVAPFKAAGATTGVRTRSGRLVKRTGIQNPEDIVVPKKVSRKAKTTKQAQIQETPQKPNEETVESTTTNIESGNVLQKANEATPSTTASKTAALHSLLSSKDNAANLDMVLRTPTKQIIKGSGKTQIKHTTGELLNLVKKELNFDEVKTKMSRSEKLQELKASLSRIQELEKTRKAQEERNRRLKENLLSPAKKVTEPAVQLKEFDKIELEVLTR